MPFFLLYPYKGGEFTARPGKEVGGSVFVLSQYLIVPYIEPM